MSETVTRHRGGGLDDDNEPVTSTDSDLTAFAVEPGASTEYRDRGRNGHAVEYAVYFLPAADLVNDDELTVRGDRFAVQVQDWQFGSFSGMVALCEMGTG